MNIKVLLAVLVALPLLVNCLPTHCEKWLNDTQWRCAKDNYGADRILIRNTAGNSNISFNISKWISKCGERGTNYSNSGRSLGPGGSYDEPFSEAESGICNELFIHTCQQDGRAIECVRLVTPSVN